MLPHDEDNKLSIGGKVVVLLADPRYVLFRHVQTFHSRMCVHVCVCAHSPSSWCACHADIAIFGIVCDGCVRPLTPPSIRSTSTLAAGLRVASSLHAARSLES